MWVLSESGVVRIQSEYRERLHPQADSYLHAASHRTSPLLRLERGLPRDPQIWGNTSVGSLPLRPAQQPVVCGPVVEPRPAPYQPGNPVVHVRERPRGEDPGIARDLPDLADEVLRVRLEKRSPGLPIEHGAERLDPVSRSLRTFRWLGPSQNRSTGPPARKDASWPGPVLPQPPPCKSPHILGPSRNGPRVPLGSAYMRIVGFHRSLEPASRLRHRRFADAHENEPSRIPGLQHRGRPPYWRRSLRLGRNIVDGNGPLAQRSIRASVGRA